MIIITKYESYFIRNNNNCILYFSDIKIYSYCDVFFYNKRKYILD